MSSSSPTTSTTGATASQAWAILKRHARDEIAPLRLQELCRDDDRVSSLVTVLNRSDDETSTILLDLSRQRMTLETINHLLRLASARQVKPFILRLAWGQNDRNNPIRSSGGTANVSTRFERSTPRSKKTEEAPIPSMHLALRVPAEEGYEMLLANGTNALTQIHRDWERIERLSDALRRGQLRGVTGNMIRDIVVVGRGVPVMALRFVYHALLKDESARMSRHMGLTDNSMATTSMASTASRITRRHIAPTATVYGYRRIQFLTSVDPIAAATITADLDPASTLVISIALKGNEETGLATRTMKNWLLQSLASSRRSDLIMSKHMLLVTGNERIAAANKPESVFLIPDHSRCEAFTTFTAATLLPLAIVFGWPIVEDFLAGAHDMDVHFVDTTPRHNLPVLLALTDVWNDAFFGSPGRIVTPFTEACAEYPSFVAALEAQTTGNPSGTSEFSGGSHRNQNKLSCSSVVLDGGLHCAYDRSMYQAGKVLPCEFVMVMDSQVPANTSKNIGLHGYDDAHATQDALMCSLFAHADFMAFGNEEKAIDVSSVATPMSSMSMDAFNSEEVLCEGNRPSALLFVRKLDAFSCGQLVALAEHRAVIKARVWGMDPFVREVGSSLRASRVDKLKEDLHKMLTTDEAEEEEENEESAEDGQRMNLSTKTILGHYADIMRDQRLYVVKGTG